MKRRAGSEKRGGRCKASSAEPEAVEAIDRIVQRHTAGSPVKPEIRWTNRSPRDIADELYDLGFSLCPETVRRILREDLGLGLRQAVKNETTCNYPYRDEQFNYIAELRDQFEFWGRPVLSIDAKAKEKLGDFYRPGGAWTDGHVMAPDHDFSSRATGKLTPYGVYDVGRNEGLMMLTASADTAELACDAVGRWWLRVGKWRYPSCSKLLLLCDCGGSNGNRQYLFKESIKNLAMRLGLTIRVAHYPPGCSKYNPIERSMFCHVARSLQGVILDSIDTAAHFIGQTSTAAGLTVIVEKARKAYHKAKKATQRFLDHMPILFDDHLPELNYYATPFDY
jgi:hypothetical protein